MKPTIVQESSEGVVLTIHVQPKASRTEWVGLYGEALKIRVAAPPVERAANDELARFLADQFGIPTRSVEIQSGGASRHKRVLLKGVSAKMVKQVCKL